MNQKIIPIQFQEQMINEIDKYIEEGLYSSKAEFIRESVRARIIELKKQLFWNKIEQLKNKNKNKNVKIKTPFLTKKEKEEIFEEIKKELK